MKNTKHQIKALRYLHDTFDGVVPSSQWTTGSRRWTTRRTPPPFTRLMSIRAAMRLPGAVGKAARRLHADRPRVELVVAIINLRGARRALRAEP